MVTDITITVLPAEEGDERLILDRVASALNVGPARVAGLVFRKRSIDARHGRVKILLRYSAYVDEAPPSGDANAASGEVPAGVGSPGLIRRPSFQPAWRAADPAKRVVIVGSGPAGLFAALRLLEYGITPIVIERGAPTSERKRDIADITRSQRVNAESNYCFGEGGAGTFSDGKLYTRSSKRGDPSRILAIFAHHGADASILTDAQPHIGTDRLPQIINRIRETICQFGGEVRFHERCVGFVMESGRVVGVRTRPSGGVGEEGGASPAGDVRETRGDAVILATGHSARDVYSLVDEAARAAGSASAALEAKGFAMGVRVEHPRALIDRIQYHGQVGDLPAATYRLTAQADGRGVYSFCMCPGGLVVPSASADDEIVVNGMSPSSRNARWSNAAIVVEIRPEDAAAALRELSLEDNASADGNDGPGATKESADPLVGLRYQQWLEREAKRQGDGQRAPAQRLVDFLAGRASDSLPETSYSPGVVPSRLDRWLPSGIAGRLRSGFADFDRQMRGFISHDALLIAAETRTSSPVRVCRDPVTLESVALGGLYPAGEGSGYAGGIASSAMDGEKCADSVARRLGLPV